MLLSIIGGYLLAPFVPFIFRISKAKSGWILAIIPILIFIYFSSFYPRILSGETITFVYEWVPSLGLSMSFYLDGLSLLFATLISGFGALIFIYSGTYLRGHQLLDRFYIYLLIFMASMLGVVLSGNIISIFLFWELTSFSSYLLIGFNHENEGSRKAAQQALLVTVGGGLALLIGFILIGVVANGYEIKYLLSSSELLSDHIFYAPIIIFILIGALTKSAQFPFYFWLPNAMAAPTPVSAYLHSATMVKAGIYLIARFTPILGNSPLWHYIIVISGGTTMVIGAYKAIYQTDIKKTLAFTTVSALGIIVMTLGIGSGLAVRAAVTFLVAHAFYKGALFLIAGNIDKQTKSRDINILSGLFKKMPYTGTAAILSCISMAAILPMPGFIAKEMVLEATLASSIYPVLLTAGVLASGVAFVVVGILLSFKLFFGSSQSQNHQAEKDAGFSMILGPIILAAFSLLLGLFSNQALSAFMYQATEAIRPGGEPFKLGLWHGLNTPLILSIITVSLGVALYYFRSRLEKGTLLIKILHRVSPEELYFSLIRFLKILALRITSRLQNGYLRGYITVIFITFIGIGLFVTTKNNLFGLLIQKWSHSLEDIQLHEVLVLLTMLIAVGILFIAKSRLTAIIALGIVGYGVGLIFIFFGAPDVAITQFLIETLTVILFVLVLHKLPEFRKFERFRLERLFMIIPILFGTFMTFILLLVTNNRLTSRLKEYFVENSYSLGKGKNIVNVILVDFRALDTMGEITVLSIAAIGIFSLLNLKLKKKETDL